MISYFQRLLCSLLCKPSPRRLRMIIEHAGATTEGLDMATQVKFDEKRKFRLSIVLKTESGNPGRIDRSDREPKWTNSNPDVWTFTQDPDNELAGVVTRTEPLAAGNARIQWSADADLTPGEDRAVEAFSDFEALTQEEEEVTAVEILVEEVTE